MAGTSMRDIKHRVQSVKSIENITNAMKLVSAAKLRRSMMMYDKAQESLPRITARIDEIFHNPHEVPNHYLLGGREIKRTCYVVVTSNRGLAGGYNANVIKTAERELAAHEEEEGRETPLLVCIGSKGRDYFVRRGYEVFAEYLGTPEGISFSEAAELAAPLIELFESGEIDEIVEISTFLVSAIEHQPQIRRLLPFDAWGSADDHPPHDHPLDTWRVEYEPDAKRVLGYLVGKYTEMMLFRCIIEAAVCEHAARRTAMQHATDNAHDMMEALGFSFNRARQAAITREITEIVGGADAVTH
ncbi:MAG: ATP synthase F1 subunit gamma [Clostridiales bacterium]|nr:ATP synthase F1 subunit gamma [Clostridiales bacterium]